MDSILIDLAVGGTLFVIANFVATKFTKGRVINKAKHYAVLIISIGILIKEGMGPGMNGASLRGSSMVFAPVRDLFHLTSW